MQSISKDVHVLRELSERYLEVCNQEDVVARRALWSKHNSLKRTRIPIYVRGWPSSEVPEVCSIECEDPFYQGQERWLRRMLYQAKIGDDFTLEPWLTVPAVHEVPPGTHWGVEAKHVATDMPGGAWKGEPPIKEPGDEKKLIAPYHKINEEATAANVARLKEAVGDIIEIDAARGPAYRAWHGEICCDLADIRGLEQIMWDMVDKPEWLHSLLAFMRDGILKLHQEVEDAGDWTLTSHINQAMPYAEELDPPRPNSGGVKRDRLWAFFSAQEFTLISPDMHEEFMLRYQMPIMEKFGLVSYGCCEDLTEKIDMLRSIPNLRRIAVTPWADVRRCAEQIGTDYVLSWRPNPAEMVCCGFDPDHIRKVIREGLEASKGCIVDITLKDIQTVENQPERLAEWVKVVREISDEY